MISVIVIEDNELMRAGIVAMLQMHDDIEAIGESGSGKAGLALLESQSPDVAIIDIGLPDLDGFQLTRQFKRAQPSLKVLLLTCNDSEEAVLSAFQAGADSYCLKEIGERLPDALRETVRGNSWLDPKIARIIVNRARSCAVETATPPKRVNSEPPAAAFLNHDPLTPRELEVLELIVEGKKNDEIAKALYISVGTVKSHLRNIMDKLMCGDRTQTAVTALRLGLLQ